MAVINKKIVLISQWLASNGRSQSPLSLAGDSHYSGTFATTAIRQTITRIRVGEHVRKSRLLPNGLETHRGKSLVRRRSAFHHNKKCGGGDDRVQ